MAIEILEPKMNKAVLPALGKAYYQKNFCDVIARELMQNSIDSLATEIRVTFQNNTITIIDNGIGIPKVKDLLDTIGKSIKPENISSIGGFGIAKIAVFACKYWKFLSISGSYKTGYIFDPDEKIEHGTIVTCEFEPNDVHWNYEGDLKTYLESINRKNLTIFYNDKIINQAALAQMQFGNKLENISKTGKLGYATIRVNGLPTFDRYIENLQDNIVIDYRIESEPYEEDYPLTANRDNFREDTKEFKDLKDRISAISKKLEVDKKLAENIYKSVTDTIFRNKRYISKGDVKDSDYRENSMEISSFERYIKQICDVLGYSQSNLKFGLSDGSQEDACYSEDTFNIRKGIDDKGYILALAEHEFVHHMGYGLTGHDQQFGSNLTYLTGKINTAIFNGTFRK